MPPPVSKAGQGNMRSRACKAFCFAASDKKRRARVYRKNISCVPANRAGGGELSPGIG